MIRGSPQIPLLQAATAPKQPWDRGAGEPITSHRTSWVSRITTTSGRFYCKTYDYSWRGGLAAAHRCTGPFRRSRAAAEYDALRWMVQAGLPAPEPIAALEWRRWLLLRRAVLITREFPGESAEQLLASLAGPERGDLGRAIVQHVARLHRLGFRDRNLDLRNLIAHRTAAGGWTIAKIDSPRHRLTRPGPAHDRWARADWRRLVPQLAATGLDDATLAALIRQAEDAGRRA